MPNQVITGILKAFAIAAFLLSPIRRHLHPLQCLLTFLLLFLKTDVIQNKKTQASLQ